MPQSFSLTVQSRAVGKAIWPFFFLGNKEVAEGKLVLHVHLVHEYGPITGPVELHDAVSIKEYGRSYISRMPRGNAAQGREYGLKNKGVKKIRSRIAQGEERTSLPKKGRGRNGKFSAALSLSTLYT